MVSHMSIVLANTVTCQVLYSTPEQPVEHERTRGTAVAKSSLGDHTEKGNTRCDLHTASPMTLVDVGMPLVQSGLG